MTADEAYLRDCILLPNTHACRRLSADHAEFRRRGQRDQIVELIAYIKSLATDQTRSAGSIAEEDQQ